MPFKILDIKTGLFSSGGIAIEYDKPAHCPDRTQYTPYTHPDHPIFKRYWCESGKIWKFKAHVKSHVKLYGMKIEQLESRFQILEVD